MILQRLNIGKKDWAASLAHSEEGGESGAIPCRDLILLLLLEAPTGTRALCSASVWVFFPSKHPVQGKCSCLLCK